MNHTGVKKTPQNLSALLHIFFTKFPQTKSILPFLHIELYCLLKIQNSEDRQPLTRTTRYRLLLSDIIGPLEKQLIPEGLCLTQACFLAWAIVIHVEDHPKTTNLSVVIQDIEDSGIKPMEATSSKSQTLGKRRILDGVHQEWSENKKIKLEPLKAI
jgi:hypothetical protein